MIVEFTKRDVPWGFWLGTIGGGGHEIRYVITQCIWHTGDIDIGFVWFSWN